ncbi:hypothetical protein MMC31_002797 [Peltigera leucophlebia]|nr:hypothetical protein [Peltigera leucophlebia]
MASLSSLIPLSCFSISTFSALVALNAPQPCRPALLGIVIAFAILAFRSITYLTDAADRASILGLFILIWLSHITTTLCVEEHTLPRQGRSWDWQAAYKMVWNGRWLRTGEQGLNLGKDAPPDGTSFRENKRPMDLQRWTFPSEKDAKFSRRRSFLLKRLCSVVTIYGLNRLYWKLFLEPHPTVFQPLDFSDFLPSKESYFRRIHTVTLRETIIRFGAVFHFVWSAWAVFTGAHDILAFLFVGIGLDEPDDWPPLYGSPGQMYTIRRFWGKFWHRLVRRTYLSWGALFSQKLLRLRRHSTLDRFVTSFTVFFLSGVVHALVTWQIGFSCGYSEDIAWFCLNFAALMAEEGVQWLIIRLFGTWNGNVSKIAGFLWVFAFFFWSLPKTEYPKILCAPA